ncbi:MAG: peptidylprolyl isomerase [Candidatus Schekmanbacteria bacterium]|nr:peptidylprolyl isomerase [Candidatus Schekmanbacteria bacterium]
MFGIAQAQVKELKPTNPKVTMVTNKGTIVIELYPQKAPITVENFVKLTKKKFYDGLSFHRYVEGFVVQGGDPAGDGTGGPGYTIKDEHKNGLTHIKGAVAMARTQNPNSAGSQFYICLEAAAFLDNQYTVFGQVIDGMDAAMQLRQGDKMQKVTVSEK